MIHPGYVSSVRKYKCCELIRSLSSYGFLAENAEFARKVEQAGLAFVGPSPEVIDSLGDKTKARTIGKCMGCIYRAEIFIRCFFIAMKIGVPVVPGTPGPVDSWEDGDAFIQEYGFPGKQLSR